MAQIEYTGIVPTDSLFWDNPSFKKVIKENNLILIDNDSNEVIDIDGPNPTEDRFRVEDPSTGNSLKVYYDDESEVDDPSPAFVEILTLMDDYLKNGAYHGRLFFHYSEDNSDDMTVDFGHRLYNTPYDFSKGCYEGEVPLDY